MSRFSHLTGAAMLLAALTPAPEIWACATCACGDPTLSVMGSEKPFAGRLRFSAAFQHRSEQIGLTGESKISVTEERLQLGAALAPTAWLMTSITVPLVMRRVTHENLAKSESLSLGDVELRAKAFLYQDRALGARHLVALHGGIELPTGPTIRDESGTRLIFEAQPGSGSFDPLAGASYAFFADPWSIYASTTIIIPTRGRLDARMGTALLSTLAGQWQPLSSLGLRLAIDTRLDGKLVENEVEDPNSGGFIAFLSPEIIVSPVTDLVIQGLVRIPVVDELTGAHDEGVVVLVGVGYDL